MLTQFPQPVSHQVPLTFLPPKPVQEYRRRSLIYDAKQPFYCLHLIIAGQVKVSFFSDGGQATSRVLGPEDLFGESALIGQISAESASALEDVMLMAWTREEIETQIERNPRLAMGLVQYVTRQCVELQDRIENMAFYKTPQRVMLALVQLAGSLGKPMADGLTRLSALTHSTLAEYVGTPREVVSIELNRLRRIGSVRYTRKFIDIHVPVLQDALRAQGIRLPICNPGEATRQYR